MRRICEETESIIDRTVHLEHSLEAVGGWRDEEYVSPLRRPPPRPREEYVCASAVKAAVDARCPLIIAITNDGDNALILAKYRPQAPIMAITPSERTFRQLSISSGVIPVLTSGFGSKADLGAAFKINTDADIGAITEAINHAKDTGLVKPGDHVVAVQGQFKDCDDPPCWFVHACA